MAKMILHKEANRQNQWGGTSYRTLCGRTNRQSLDGMNIADTASGVTCKICLALMAARQPHKQRSHCALAAAIRAGDLSGLPRTDYGDGYYELADWQSAADSVLDSGDEVELAAMLDTERAFEAFAEWQYAGGDERKQRCREHAGFATWRHDRERWGRKA